MTYPWPGNVRELRSALAAVAVLVDGAAITRAHLEAELDGGRPPLSARDELLHLLGRHEWNVSAAAREVGRSRTTLYSWMRMQGVDRSSGVPG